MLMKTERQLIVENPRRIYKAALSDSTLLHAQIADDHPVNRGLPWGVLRGILKRRRGLVLTVAAVGITLFSLVALLVPPKYTAKALLEIESQQIDFTDEISTDVHSADDSNIYYSNIETHVTSLASHDFLQGVIESLRGARGKTPTLTSNQSGTAPEVKTNSASTPKAAVGEPVDEVKSFYENLEKEVVNIHDALTNHLQVWLGEIFKSSKDVLQNVDTFERFLKVTQEGRTRVISVAYTSPDPEMASTVVNRIVQRYVASRIERKQAVMKQELARIDKRISGLMAEAARTNAQALSVFRDPRIGSPGVIAAETRYPNLHSNMPTGELLNEAAAARRLQPILERRHNYILGEIGKVQGDARILSQASPPLHPSSINPLILELPALLFFLVCGVWLAVFLERSNVAMRSAGDVADALGIDCAALAPKLPRKPTARSLLQTLQQPLAPYTQAIQSVINNLTETQSNTSSTESPKVVMICSSVPGEGKTTFVVSLATLLALRGRRVLIVNFDLPHELSRSDLASKHKSSELNGIDQLINAQSPADAIQNVSELGFDYLPMGPWPRDSSMLLDPQGFPRLLHQLRQSYDHVLFDCPPLLGVTSETPLLAKLSDKILLLAKWGSITPQIAQNSLRLLQGSGWPDVVAVVTQVDLQKHAKYGFGDFSEFIVKYRRSRGKYAKYCSAPKVSGAAKESLPVQQR
jgi:Mrp family chromosome partitioning ATPase/uncharacterized protein involved in exopolysaccharide biosynthesis